MDFLFLGFGFRVSTIRRFCPEHEKIIRRNVMSYLHCWLLYTIIAVAAAVILLALGHEYNYTYVGLCVDASLNIATANTTFKLEFAAMFHLYARKPQILFCRFDFDYLILYRHHMWVHWSGDDDFWGDFVPLE